MSGEIHDMETESSEDEAEEIIRETINKTEHNQPKPQETKRYTFLYLVYMQCNLFSQDGFLCSCCFIFSR